MRIVKVTKVGVDFGQLLEDITYTNMVMKTFDVSDIITRNRYYELKDSIVLWLLKHNFTENLLDGLEYTTGKCGDRVGLVRLTIRYGGTECLLHQNLDRKICEMFGLHDTKDEDFEEYASSVYDVEFDESRFRECIERMRVNRMRFLRERLDNNSFWQAVAVNGGSSNPWMRFYLGFLPMDGRTRIRISDKNQNK